MFWLIFWLLSLFLFLVLPVVCVDESRQRWIKRFRQCRWNVDPPVDNLANFRNHRALSSSQHGVVGPGNGAGNSSFHFVLSKGQEDDIRESFLVERLKHYSQELTEDHIERPRANSRSVFGENEETDVEGQQQLACTNNDKEEPDIENGGLSKEGDKIEDDDLKNKRTNETDPSITVEEENENDDNDNNNDNSNNAADGASDDGSSDDDMMGMLEFTGEDDGSITIPLAGECRPDVLPANVKGSYRKEPNGCAVCLCPFDVADTVTWSSNPACQHVFHDDCIKGWLMALGRKFLKRQRREQRRTGNLSYDSDPIAKITGFPMLCPCCRQHFILPEEEEESVDVKEDENNAGANTPPPPAEVSRSTPPETTSDENNNTIPISVVV